MLSLARECGPNYLAFGRSQDVIGWRRFMEGMVSKQLGKIQAYYLLATGSRLSLATWSRTLVVKLLEVTHGQWLYRNVQVHDIVSGVHANARKDKLRKALQDQLDLGGEELDAKDRYLLEINLGDIETTSGEEQTYWLLALLTAKEARRIRLREEAERSAVAARSRVSD